MTRECDERMWNLAYRLARSGEHRNCQTIEWELRAFGYPQAPELLDHEGEKGPQASTVKLLGKHRLRV
jgi:hypothetical protein